MTTDTPPPIDPTRRRHWGTWSVARALRVLHALGLREARVTDRKILLPCPTAAWTHPKGVDTHPSCAVLVDGDGACYRCLSCGAHGSLLSLVWAYQLHHDRDYTAALYEVHEVAPPTEAPAAALDYRVGGPALGPAVVRAYGAPVGRQLGLDGREAPPPPKRPYAPPPEAEAAIFAAAPPPAYAAARGLSPATYARWGLGHDERHRRLVFPVRHPDGALAGFTARLYWASPWCYRCGEQLERDDGSLPHACPRCRALYAKYLHTPGMPKGTLLYGAHLHPRASAPAAAPAPVVLVEGPLDAIALHEHGVRYPMACLGAAVTPAQLTLAARLAGGAPIYACGDGDRAGQAMNAAITTFFHGLAQPVIVVPLPEGRDPGGATAADVAAWGLPVEIGTIPVDNVGDF